MINGAVATIYVSNLDRAVSFYTEVLGLKLQFQGGSHWAQIDAGGGFTIGLHPAGPYSPKPGTQGSISVGFNVDGSLDNVVESLKANAVSFRGPVVDDGPIRLAFFADPDGNDLYLCEYRPR